MDPLQRTPGTAPTALSQDPPWLRRREQISLVKNRMREICTSGSVRDGDGNAPIYSALGMGGLDLDENHVRRYLGRHLIILLGDADTDGSAPDLPRDDFAMAPGPHRLARGQWYFEHCAKLAERLGTAFGWRLQTVRGAGHVSQEVFDRAANILKSSA